MGMGWNAWSLVTKLSVKYCDWPILKEQTILLVHLKRRRFKKLFPCTDFHIAVRFRSESEIRNFITVYQVGNNGCDEVRHSNHFCRDYLVHLPFLEQYLTNQIMLFLCRLKVELHQLVMDSFKVRAGF